MASSKRKAKGAAPAAHTPGDQLRGLMVSVNVLLTPVEEGGDSVSVNMGLSVDGPEALGQVIVANEAALRPIMMAFRDAVLRSLGGVGPFPLADVASVESEAYPAPTTSFERFVKLDGRGGNA